MRPLDQLATDAAARARFTLAIPHSGRLGMILVEVAPGVIRMDLPWQAEFAYGPDGALDRGVLPALLDTACGAALRCVQEAPAAYSTLSLRMAYLRAIPPRTGLQAYAECEHFDGTYAYLRAGARAGGLLVATASATFMMRSDASPGGPAFNG